MTVRLTSEGNPQLGFALPLSGLVMVNRTPVDLRGATMWLTIKESKTGTALVSVDSEVDHIYWTIPDPATYDEETGYGGWSVRVPASELALLEANKKYWIATRIRLFDGSCMPFLYDTIVFDEAVEECDPVT